MDLKNTNPLDPPKGPQIKLTPEMINSFSTLTCDCGGQLFHPGIIFKKISPLISPTGKEELYPIEVLVCDSCGKVPNETNTMQIIPQSVLAQNSGIGTDKVEKLTNSKAKPFSVQKNEDKTNK